MSNLSEKFNQMEEIVNNLKQDKKIYENRT